MAGIEVLSRRSGVSKENIADVFKAVKDLIEEGDKVAIRAFGTFKPGLKAESSISSPVLKDGNAKVPARRVMKFHMADTLKKEWVFNTDKEYKAAVKAVADKAKLKDEEAAAPKAEAKPKAAPKADAKADAKPAAAAGGKKGRAAK